MYLSSYRWKQLFELEKQQRDQLESQIKEARERLLEEEGFAVKDWHTQQLRFVHETFGCVIVGLWGRGIYTGQWSVAS